MATVRMSVAMQDQILELHAKEYSERRIARMLKIGRNTVRAELERGAAVAPGSAPPGWAKSIDWERVRLEVSRGVQLNILAKELAGEVISYSQFCFMKTPILVFNSSMILFSKRYSKTQSFCLYCVIIVLSYLSNCGFS